VVASSILISSSAFPQQSGLISTEYCQIIELLWRSAGEGLIIQAKIYHVYSLVEIRKEQNMIVVVPVTADDPILGLGKQPITLDVDDAFVNHDRYLYGR
jgi:hypothetical protein